MNVRRAGLLAATGVLLALCGCASSRAAVHAGEEMPYASNEAPKAGEIRHVPTGLEIPFEGAMDMISGARLVCVGETHDNIHAHGVELAILKELYRRYPGKVAVGMEMFREPDQDALDRWTSGELTEIDFLRATKWYENWGSDFGYYRAILDFARDNRIDVIALNPPKELQRQVRESGLDNLPADLSAKLPVIGEPDPYQRSAMKAVYGAHLRSEGAFDAFFRVQLLWEETMAERIVDYLRGTKGEGKRMVTFTGGWHVKYGFGIPKKVVRRMPMPYVIVLPEEISIPEEKKDQIMEVDLPPIPLLAADFIWWVPYEGLEGRQAVMGVRIAGIEGAVLVEAVTPGSPAEKAGIEKGDRIVSFDGHAVRDATDVFLRVRAKESGDEALVNVQRDGIEKSLRVRFFPITGGKAH